MAEVLKAGQIMSQPGISVADVTPSDTTELTDSPARALWVGGAGNVAVVCPDNSAATLVGVAAGTLIPVMVIQVKSTGTTATNIVAIG